MSKRDHLVIHEGKDGQFYWRLVRKNGRTMADGAEGYKTRTGAKRAAKRVIEVMKVALLDGDRGK